MKIRTILCLLLALCFAATAAPASAGSRIDSDEELLSALAEMRELKAVGFELSLAKKYFAGLTENDFAGFSMILLQAGVTNYRMQYSSSGDLKLDDVAWTEPHVAVCGTEEEFRVSVRDLLSQQVPCCQIAVGNPALLNELIGRGLPFQYTAMYGAEKVTVRSVSGNRCVIYLDDIMYYSDPWFTVSSADEWRQAAERMAETDADRFFLIPGDAFAQELQNNPALADRLEALCPMAEWRSYYSDTGLTYRYEYSARLAGERIRCAYARNSLSGLKKREREALSAALDMAEACRRNDPLETAKEIHDALCRTVVYTDDGSTEEDDCAVGALLNGQANCDGYADAFRLVGFLAGLDVRYQQGNGRQKEPGGRYRDVGHLWNLLKIDGTWRMVDVTWDDQADRILYTWFNIGADRARRAHVWDTELSLPLAEHTVLSERPGNEYPVRNPAEITAAVSDAAAKGLPSFTLIVAEGASLSSEAILDALKKAVSRPFSYSWNDYMLTMDILFD